MFKIGEIVVPVNNDKHSGLTVGKGYEVHSYVQYSEWYTVVINDNGILEGYPENRIRFVTLLGYRKLRLEKICSRLGI